MRNALFSRLSLVLLAAAIGSGICVADEPWTTDDLVAMAKREATSDTSAFLHLRLSAAPVASFDDPVGAVDAVAPRTMLAIEDLATALGMHRADALARAFGVREAFVVVDFEGTFGLDLPPSRILLRVDPRCDKDLLIKTLSELRSVYDFKLEGDVLRFQYGSGRQPQDALDEDALRQAFGSMASAPWRAFLIPSRRYTFRNPTLPPQRFPTKLHELADQAVSGDLVWGVIGYEPANGGRLALRAAAKDAEAATRFSKLWRETFFAALQTTNVEAAVTEELLARITPVAEGDRLRLDIDGADPQTATALAKALSGAEQGAAPSAQPSEGPAGVEAMQKIITAVIEYHDYEHAFPPSAVQALPTVPNAPPKGALSWRVHLLPRLGLNTLYSRFRLDEPWNSEHNRKLVAEIPAIYASADPAVAIGHTTFVMPLFPDSPATATPEPQHMGGIMDGTSNTVLLVEAAPDQAVVWTKPDDLEIDVDKFAKLVGPKDSKQFAAGFADGKAFALPKALEKEQVRLLLQHRDDAQIDLRGQILGPEATRPRRRPAAP